VNTSAVDKSSCLGLSQDQAQAHPFCVQLHHRPRGASLHLCGLELNLHRSRAYARNKGCAIAGWIQVEKLESDTDSLPNL